VTVLAARSTATTKPWVPSAAPPSVADASMVCPTSNCVTDIGSVRVTTPVAMVPRPMVPVELRKSPPAQRFSAVFMPPFISRWTAFRNAPESLRRRELDQVRDGHDRVVLRPLHEELGGLGRGLVRQRLREGARRALRVPVDDRDRHDLAGPILFLVHHREPLVATVDHHLDLLRPVVLLQDGLQRRGVGSRCGVGERVGLA
jgi:hypothetical protein